MLRSGPTARIPGGGRAARVNAGRVRRYGMLFSGGVKMYMDGSGGARTAWMHEDWNKNLNDVDTGNAGYPNTPPDQYRTMATNFHKAGVHVSTHAIGDKAIDWVIDTYAQALAAAPTKGLRHGLIHANTPTDHANDEMARLQRDYDAAFPEASASFMWWIGDTYAGNFGPRRNARMKPFRTWVRKGVRWGGGSSFSVTPFPARYGIWASVRARLRQHLRQRPPSAWTNRWTCAPRSKSSERRVFLDDASARSKWGRTPTSPCGTATPTPCRRRPSRT
jgi:predicted amidohydrolase YtcJ